MSVSALLFPPATVFRRLILLLPVFVLLAAGSAPASAETDAEPGVWLEMGLFACEQGRRTDAERIFAHIRTHFDPPPGILALVERARISGCTPPPGPVRGRAAVGVGWLANANQGASERSHVLAGTIPITLVLDPKLAPQADFHAAAEADWRWGESPATGQVTVMGYARQNATRHDFDESGIGLTALRELAFEPYRLRVSATYQGITLGSAHYADLLALGIGLQRHAFVLDGLWQRVNYPHYAPFNAQQSLLRAGVAARWRDWSFTARAGLLLDQGTAARPGGDRRGWVGDLEASHPAPWDSVLRVVLRGEATRSREPYAPGIFDMRRIKHFWHLEASWTVPADASRAWRLNVFTQQAQDTVPFLSFRQTGIALNHVWLLR